MATTITLLTLINFEIKQRENAYKILSQIFNDKTMLKILKESVHCV